VRLDTSASFQESLHTSELEGERKEIWIKMVNLDFVSVSVSSASATTVAITITNVTMVVQVVGNPQTFAYKTGNGKREDY
jgi:hypothetical protein